MLSFAGLLGYLGVNSRGLAVGLNLVLGGRWSPGVPPYLAIRHILDIATSVESAVAALRSLPFASSRTIVLADATETACVEVIGGEHRVMTAPESVHTNHFLAPDFTSRDELNVFAHNSSLRRFQAAEAGLRDLPADADPDEHFAVLSQTPICVADDGDIRRERTVTAVVLDAKNGALHLRPGDPRLSRTRSFALGSVSPSDPSHRLGLEVKPVEDLPIRAMPDDLARVNLGDPQTFADYDLSSYWRTLRATRPLYRHPAVGDSPGFWVLSRYDDIVALYRDNVTFTSERGNVLITLLGESDSAAGLMVPVTDGQRHEELRNVLLKAFSPRVLSRIGEQVRRNARSRLAVAVDRGACDFALDVASKIPMITICDLLGVPSQDQEYMLTFTKSAISSDDQPEYSAAADDARNEILQYFLGMVEERRVAPQNDVVSVLAGGTVDGEFLSEDEIVLNCYSLILGGDATARLTMIDSVHSFGANPDQWAAFKRGDVSVKQATEEALR
ncbi:C45 family autoproteolytic acyltransferase/hydolase [Streptomyces cellulosae]|uniref:C45 family autoproteolytic acyltransferase/hydolase n=1 Tax=Streptomyces cellulosae TaxID=1968 RepID=UPI000B0B737E|nr:C45 family autoproteolytic acyltransferase/hydolase [Streptomyces cellulosae]